MKWLVNILSAILLLVGIVWILQGVNVLPGSYMSGHIQYTFLGIIVGIAGAALLMIGNRRKRSGMMTVRTKEDQ